MYLIWDKWLSGERLSQHEDNLVEIPASPPPTAPAVLTPTSLSVHSPSPGSRTPLPCCFNTGHLARAAGVHMQEQDPRSQANTGALSCLLARTITS